MRLSTWPRPLHGDPVRLLYRTSTDLDPNIAYWLEATEVAASRDYVEAAIEGMPGNPLGLATRSIGGGVALATGAVATRPVLEPY